MIPISPSLTTASNRVGTEWVEDADSCRPLWVVHVSFGLDVGGQEKLLVELARHSDRSRLALGFVSLGHRGALAGDLEACGAAVVALGQPSGLKPGLVWRLARLFRRMRPDVVHTHDPRSLIYAAPAARLARVRRVVHTRHGRDVGATPRQLAMVRCLSRLVDRFVCVSEAVTELSRQQGIPGRKLSTILNGIDVSRFAYNGPNPDGSIVTVARLGPEKDVGNLVRAAALGMRAAADLRVEVAGSGPCWDHLKSLAAELGVSQRVAFLGEVRDVPAVLARARIFVLPSRSEGIPLTVLEAMARGLPVVATRVGGLTEVVIEGETGLLVPPADPARLAEAILTVWRDAGRGEAMGRAGRRRVEEHFDVRRMVAQYEVLYREGIGERSVARLRPEDGEHDTRAGRILGGLSGPMRPRSGSD
jgi:sugar transferase (PEP-CTERM/EpsH1 system associated)